MPGGEPSRGGAGAKIGRVSGADAQLRHVVAALEAVVGRPHVLTDPDVLASYTTDWTGRFRGTTGAVVRPGTTDEVAAVVTWCAEEGVALTVQGGNTGLSGGSVPLGGEIVLSLTRLDHLGDVDTVAGQVTAGAGVPIGPVQAVAAAAGWDYGVDLSSRDTATVGGTVATNAGGLHVVRHGPTRAQLLGVEAVLGTGAVVSSLRGLVKDVSGYDLAGLLCGSEGTLAVVTAARLALVPPTPARTTALLAFASAADAVDGAAELRRGLPSLHALELLVQRGLALVCRVTQLAEPFPSPGAAYLLVEAADAQDPTDALAAAVASLAAVTDVAVATTAERRAALWRYREAHTEAIATIGVPHKLDVSLPAASLAAFVDEVPVAVTRAAPAYDARTWLFGHVGDGNVHVNVTGVPPEDDAVDEAVLSLAVALGGSISAEHGIGVAKRRFLADYRSPAELEAFRAVRRALDPAGILNPNVLLGPG